MKDKQNYQLKHETLPLNMFYNLQPLSRRTTGLDPHGETIWQPHNEADLAPAHNL